MYKSSLFFLLLVAYVTASSTTYQKANVTVKPAARPASSNRVTSARSDFHHGYEHHYPHHYGGGHLGLGHYKEFDHYLLPMLIMLGIGVLLMPLMSVFMSTMVGNVPVSTVISGRRRRETVVKPISNKTIMDLWKKVGKAIEVFSKDD